MLGDVNLGYLPDVSDAWLPVILLCVMSRVVVCCYHRCALFSCCNALFCICYALIYVSHTVNVFVLFLSCRVVHMR